MQQVQALLAGRTVPRPVAPHPALDPATPIIRRAARYRRDAVVAPLLHAVAQLPWRLRQLRAGAYVHGIVDSTSRGGNQAASHSAASCP